MAGNLNFNLAVDTNAAVSSINQFFSTFDQGAAQASSKLRKAFNEPIKTEVEISLKNGELVAKKIESAKSKSKQLKDVYRALNGEIGKTPNALKRQMAILKALQGNTRKYQDSTGRLSKSWKQVEDRIRRVKAEQDRLTGSGGGGGKMDGFIGKFALVQTLANLATAAIMGLGRQVQELAATGVRMESLMLQLEAFTGGASQAEAAYQAFSDTARKTPFNVEQVANAGKIMMAFGVDAEVATEMTDRLGIVAAATGGDLENMGRNLGQIAAQGQAYTRDLHQFAMQGVPIWEEMSKVTGKSVTELKKLASEGKISFEIVSAALKNLTKDGSAFKEVANRMQETFAGRMAAIESALINVSRGMIEAFNNMDRAMGGVLSGSMRDFAAALEGLAKKLPEIGYAIGQTLTVIGGVFSYIGDLFQAVGGYANSFTAYFANLLDSITPVGLALQALGGFIDTLITPLTNAGLLLAALAGPAIVIGIGLVTKSIYGMMTATYAYIKAQIMSLGLMGPKGWVILTAAAGATAAAYLVLEDSLNKANAELEASKQEQAEAAAATKENTVVQQDLKVAIDDTVAALEREADAQKEQADKAKQAYEEQKAKSDELKDSILARIEAESTNVQALIDQKKSAIDQEKDAYKNLTEDIKRRYDDETESVRTLYDQKLALIDLELDRLSARGPAEERLRQLQKQEIIDKLRKGELDLKERAELEARLERMGRQEKMEQLSAERKKLMIEKSEKLNELEKQKEEALENAKTFHEENVALLESELETLERQKTALDEQKNKIKDMADGVEVYNGRLEDGIRELGNQISLAQQLKQEWLEIASAAAAAKEDAAAARSDAQSAAAALPAGGGSSGEARASGGPVTGGSSYQVNELGKEAFLSASGKLSMINAPAFGSWKAPSSGTVIPAHLTKQLDVPTGGINLNSAATANSSRAGSDGMSAMVKAITASARGDVFHQNVTVQSSNPTQTANNMMVEMTRLRRRRFG